MIPHTANTLAEGVAVMKSLLQSFHFAFQGLFFALRNERNMRIHLVCMLYMLYFLFRFDFFVLTRTEYAILFLANATVLGAELVNTAIECAIDLIEKKYHRLAKHTKDAAAAAVLLYALSSVAVGLVLLWQPAAFSALYIHYRSQPLLLLALLLSLTLAALFIFQKPKQKETPK